MKVFAIRHKPTGKLMPVPTGKNGSGSSYWEPAEQAEGLMPRLFPLRRSAAGALTQWLRGMHKPVTEFERDETFSPCYEITIGTEVEPVPGRIASDMELVEFTLTESN